MQALSKIDMSVNPLETVAPAKSAEPQGKQFGNVLNEQRQPEAAKPAKTKQQPAEKQDVKPEAKQTAKAEGQPVQQPKTETPVAEKDAVPEAKAAKTTSELQQTVMNLMKVIAGGETPELTEEFGSTEELLNQLVQQLEGSDLQGEQVLAGIDLTALVEQLQELNAEGGEEQLAQIVAQIEEQLTNEEGLLANAELAAAMMPTDDPQAIAPKLVENLNQARQILQKALDAVAAQKTQETVPEEAVVNAETDETGQDLLLGEEAAEEIDPRFAGLLKPRNENRGQEQPSLRQRMQGDSLRSPEMKAGDAAQVMTEVKPEQAETADVVEQLASSPKQGLENLAQQAQGQTPANAAQVQNLAGKAMPVTPMVQLPSGQQVAESQIFDQVVARFSSGVNPESGKMVLRLQPAELGSLRIELHVEGDRVRANLQAQSQQVQEVLERNLPQLRNALAEQGLKIDQFQVDVNRDQNQQNQFDQLAQQQQQRQGSQHQSRWQQPLDAEETTIPLAHLMQNGGGGISLHV